MRYKLLPLPQQIEYADEEPFEIPKDICVANCYPSLDAAVIEFSSDHSATVSNTGGHITLALGGDSSLGLEGYTLDVSSAGIRISAFAEQGLFYGLQTLKQIMLQAGEEISALSIRDFPLIRKRGILLDLRFQTFRIEYVLSLIKSWASLKYNVLNIEYSNKFPYAGRFEIIRDVDAFSAEDIRRIVDCCRERFIKIIPLVQSFGHMEYLLAHPVFSHLRENSEGNHPFFSQCCPSNPEMPDISKELLLQVFLAHDRPELISIGGDEAFHLGICPTCAAFVEQNGPEGKGLLYVRYMNQLIDYVCGLGATPIVYSDMLLAYPSLLHEMDQRAIIGDWDYDTIHETPSLMFDWSTKKNISIDELPALPEPFRSIAQQSVLPDGAHFYPFPYTKYLIEQGFQVLCHPSIAAVGPDDLWTPHYAAHVGNVTGFAASAKAYGASGIMITAWERFLMETVSFGEAIGAEASWSQCTEDVSARFSFLHYGLDDNGEIVDAMYKLSEPYTLVEKKWPLVYIPVECSRKELPLPEIYTNRELLGNISYAETVFGLNANKVKRNAESLKHWLFGVKIKRFWLEAAALYQTAFDHPENPETIAKETARLDSHLSGLKLEALRLLLPSMPLTAILVRWDDSFATYRALKEEIKTGDWRFGKKRK